MGEALVDSRGTARGELLTMRGWSAVPLGVFLVMHGSSNDERGQKRRQRWMRKGWRCLGGADSQRRGKCVVGRSVAPLGQCGERGKGGGGRARVALCGGKGVVRCTWRGGKRGPAVD
jgi:hypothetical protein